MMAADLILTADLMARGATAVLAVLLGVLLLRDFPKQAAAKLGAVFAAGCAAYALCSAPGLHARFGVAMAPVLALAAGNNLVFWLFTRALFEGDFHPHWGYGVLWGLVVAAALLAFSTANELLKSGLAVQAMFFALLALHLAWRDWRGDLIERRRRLRLFVVLAAGGHMLATSAGGIIGQGAATSPSASVASALSMLAVAVVVTVSLLRTSSQDLFAAAPLAAQEPQPGLSPEEWKLVAALEAQMARERPYRQEGLTIGALARTQGLPEYRLRKLIREGFGVPNFAAFLNRYRLAEAKAALSDESERCVPILTIALDAGFGSLGPFNRAFKAETGMTPRDFRRAALGEDEIPGALAESG